MIENIIDKIIDKQLAEQTITLEQVNIYRYGYTLVYEVLINVIIAVLIGTISGEFGEVFTFLILYIPFRSFCGGWHADKLWKCTIFSNMILIGLVVVDDWFVEHCDMWIMILAMVICLCIVFVLAPLDTNTKPIEQDERKIYKGKIKIMNILHIVLLIVLVQLDIKNVVVILTFVYITQSVLLILEYIKKCKEKEDL